MDYIKCGQCRVTVEAPTLYIPEKVVPGIKTNEGFCFSHGDGKSRDEALAARLDYLGKKYLFGKPELKSNRIINIGMQSSPGISYEFEFALAKFAHRTGKDSSPLIILGPMPTADTDLENLTDFSMTYMQSSNTQIFCIWMMAKDGFKEVYFSKTMNPSTAGKGAKKTYPKQVILADTDNIPALANAIKKRIEQSKMPRGVPTATAFSTVSCHRKRDGNIAELLNREYESWLKEELKKPGEQRFQQAAGY